MGEKAKIIKLYTALDVMDNAKVRVMCKKAPETQE